MAEPAGPFHLLRAGPGRFLCYCRPGPGPGGTVYVTDALEVWAGELGARPPLGCGRLGPGNRRAERGRGAGRAAAAGREPVLGAASLQAAHRRGEEPAPGAAVRHGGARPEPGATPGSGGNSGIFLQPCEEECFPQPAALPTRPQPKEEQGCCLSFAGQEEDPRRVSN
ncbi:protein PAXX isoform X4 [Patagioenas fasciata]|uniref:protein PAXX isoform X4 n=1 Tax=Patagioenas fasciata TaxID=372321 RepID=UPI003A997202